MMMAEIIELVTDAISVPPFGGTYDFDLWRSGTEDLGVRGFSKLDYIRRLRLVAHALATCEALARCGLSNETS